jgi:acyl-CoA reductase-like NAD-dependent aldehyde dehydrogenase
MVENYQMYIDGQWCEASSGGRFPAINPFSQEEWASIPQATTEDVERAVTSARKAFNTRWRLTSGLERATLMHRLADLIEKNAQRLAHLESTDNGKIIRETYPQMFYTARIFRFFAGYADKLFGSVIPLDQRDVFDYVVREPCGVIGIITAWNSPITLLANKLPAALAAGNCAVIKPSEHASASTLELCKLVEEAGFPPGVINVVTGDANTGRALVSNADLDKISFTGSTHGGREIASAAGRNLTPVILELGGKSPNIIFDDCDLDKAIVGALAGIFAATGQTCQAGSRLLVQRSLVETVAARLAERAMRIVLGNPTDRTTEMGTVANEPQFVRILDHIEAAKKEGARLIAGGARAVGDNLSKGLFVQPTIFADVDNSMRIAQEEIFGPVLSIIPFDSEEDAVRIGNGTSFGLAAGVWTRDISRAMRMSRELRSGGIWINTYRMMAAQAPFGGIKDSGYGRERGEQGIAEFTVVKNVMIDFSDTDRDPFAMKS